MSRRKSNKSKAKWEVIRTEDELRAEAAAREAAVRAKSEEATEVLIAATAMPHSQNPFIFVNGLFQPLWLCAVVLYGLIYLGWSPASVLVCFWFEKLTRIALVAARIYIHQVATKKRGHFRAQLGFLPKGSKSRGLAFERRAATGSGTRLFVSSGGSPATRFEGTGTLLSNFVWVCAIGEVFGLLVMLWALKGMEEWTASSGVWAFIWQEWLNKSWIIVLPLVIQFVIETFTTLRKMSFQSIKTLAVTTHSSTSIMLPLFWIALLIAQYFDWQVLLPLVYLLVISKTLYETSLVIFGRNWETGFGDRLESKLWGDDPAYARYAKQEAERRRQDEEPMRD
jgi:hypothetical protein